MAFYCCKKDFKPIENVKYPDSSWGHIIQLLHSSWGNPLRWEEFNPVKFLFLGIIEVLIKYPRIMVNETLKKIDN